MTTIGFSRITPVVATSNGQGQKKTVSFKSTSLNTSNSTTDNSHDDEDDENDESGEGHSDDDSNQMSGDDNADNNEAALNPANMFVSDEERKKYLDEKFKETTSLYEKIIKRMERENLLSF